MNESISGECVFCEKPLHLKAVQKLTEVGVKKVDEVCERLKSDIKVIIGQLVHNSCRKSFVDEKNVSRKAKKIQDLQESSAPSRFSPKKTRSIINFNFKDYCLYCGEEATLGDKKQPVHRVLTSENNFDKTVKAICQRRNDKWAMDVLGRISCVGDLRAADAIYHNTCDVNFRTGKNVPRQIVGDTSGEQTKLPRSSVGRPVDTEKRNAFLKTIEYCEKTCEENEFCTVSELQQKMRDFLNDDSIEPYTVRYLKKSLIEHFQDNILIASSLGLEDVIFLREKNDEILRKFYSDKSSGNTQDDKLRLLITVGKLIRSDCLEVNQSSDHYPTHAEIASTETCCKMLPISLLTVLQTCAPGESNKLKIAAIGQAIVQLIRPRSLMLPLQVALGVQMHHCYASKKLIDILHKIGFSISYNEVLNYERNAAALSQDYTQHLKDHHFTQFIADNVDHNLSTIDGKNSFHGMGIIGLVTPTLKTSKLVPRKVMSSADVRLLDKMKLSYYNGSEKNIQRVYAKLPLFEAEDQYKNLDLLWKMSWLLSPKACNWSGFMQLSTSADFPGKSSIFFFPIIDMNPSDFTCLYSTLLFVATQAKKFNVEPVLTLDQPLYWKVLIIIDNEPENSPLKRIVVRLAAFHTTMSFSGCIGHFMESSGIEEMLVQIYGDNTVKHILKGQPVARAVRAFMLLDAALNYNFIREVFDMPFDGELNDEAFVLNVDDQQLKDVSILLAGLTEKSITAEEVCDENIWNIIGEKLKKHKKSVIKTSPNSKLWFQFMEMVDILREFLRAERTGDWLLHLKSLHRMLPYFAAAGHSFYCKSARLYLQQMAELPQSHPSIYKQFMAGFHVGRRTERYWAGLSTDLLIEQVLMNNIKNLGGLTRGSGFTESRRLTWLLGMPACADINSAMIKLLQLEESPFENHKDCSVARQNKDLSDVRKLIKIIHDMSPFQPDTSLKNLATGKVADPGTNVDNAFNVGTEILKSMDEQKVAEFVFKKRSTVKTMSAINVLKIDDDAVQIDPQLLFQRLLCILNNTNDNLTEFFAYELCTYPMALCDNSGFLRAPKKTDLVDSLLKITNLENCNGNDNSDTYFVIDGGHLLHQLPWPRNIEFKDLFEQYSKFVLKHFGKATIVSGGFSTKDMTHLRRSKGRTGPTIDFKDNMPLTLTKSTFLSNEKNKEKFLVSLANHLRLSGCVTIQAPDDADLYIVQEAIKQAEKRPTTIIGKDTDLLVLSLHYYDPNRHKSLFISSDNVSLFSKKKEVKNWDVKQMKASLGNELCSKILFCHAFLGCDCTSHIYGIHKGKILNLLKQDKSTLDYAAAFYDNSSSKSAVIKAGEKLLVRLYGGKESETLDSLRFKVFTQKIASNSSRVKPESLPPTLAAAKFHFLRVFLQVMTWMNYDLDPKSWGWKEDSSGLVPILTEKAPAPDTLLRVIRCNCKEDGCFSHKCSCKKHGIMCSYACKKCQGTTCCNKPPQIPLLDNEDDLSDAADNDATHF